MNEQDRKRAQLSKHVLTEILSGPCPASHQTEPVRLFRMAEPGTRVMSVDLFFGAGRIWISGDLRVTEDRGVISDLGYGLSWFAGQLYPDYLAEKFLRKRHVPTRAVAELMDRAERYFEDHCVDEPDEEDRQVKRALEEAAAQGEHGPCASSHELFELFGDLGLDTSDGAPGWGYDPDEVEWLSAIQQRFAELYTAADGSTSMRASCSLA